MGRLLSSPDNSSIRVLIENEAPMDSSQEASQVCLSVTTRLRASIKEFIVNYFRMS